MPELYEPKTVQVLVIGSQGGVKRISCRADQNIVTMRDGTKIDFKLSDVTPIWCPGFPFGSWKQGIIWRAGTSCAIDPRVKDSFVPVLSQGDSKKFIDRQVFDAANNDRKPMKDWQFVLLILLIAATLVISIFTLAGFHLSGPAVHSVTNSTVTATPTPLVIR